MPNDTVAPSAPNDAGAPTPPHDAVDARVEQPAPVAPVVAPIAPVANDGAAGANPAGPEPELVTLAQHVEEHRIPLARTRHLLAVHPELQLTLASERTAEEFAALFEATDKARV